MHEAGQFEVFPINGIQTMSRIYELIRQAEEYLLRSELPSGDGIGALDMQDRSSGRHWELGTHITVYGQSLYECPFYEELKAFSVNVNSDGCLLLLSAPVSDGQDLLLINTRTSQEQICRVVHAVNRDAQRSEVAVMFPSPNPKFWQGAQAPIGLNEALAFDAT
jgi:hypothetical protein